MFCLYFVLVFLVCHGTEGQPTGGRDGLQVRISEVALLDKIRFVINLTLGHHSCLVA